MVLCMDVGFSMSHSGPGEESPFEQAKKVMTTFVQRQVKKNLMGGTNALNYAKT